MSHLEQFDHILIVLSKKYYYGFFNVYVPSLTWEDIAQDLRIKLLEKEKKYDSKRSYDDWAYVVCNNALRDMIKKYKRQKRGVALVSSYGNMEGLA